MAVVTAAREALEAGNAISSFRMCRKRVRKSQKAFGKVIALRKSGAQQKK
jgi:hypothetical protein